MRSIMEITEQDIYNYIYIYNIYEKYYRTRSCIHIYIYTYIIYTEEDIYTYIHI